MSSGFGNANPVVYGANDLLIDQAAFDSSPYTYFSDGFICSKAYEAFLVIVIPNTSPGTIVYCAMSGAGVAPASALLLGHGSPPRTSNVYQAIVPAFSPASAFVPGASGGGYSPGGVSGAYTLGSVSITVWLNEADAGTWSVVGLTRCPTPVRPDGRAYPLGSLGVNSYAGVPGTNTLVAAPPSPLRLLLRQLTARAASSYVDVQGTVGGAPAELLGVNQTAAGQITQGYESGLLLDVGAPLTYFTGGAGGAGAAYDIVV